MKLDSSSKRPSSTDDASRASKKPKPSSTSTKPQPSPRSATTTTSTLRPLPWTYLHLSLLPAEPTAASLSRAAAVSEITARAHLQSALTRYLGLMGAAVAIDVLRVDGRDVWIRVAGDDGAAVAQALSAWVGGAADDGAGVAWRVRRRGQWLGAVLAGDGDDLFEAA